jgi:hypothetical protein
MKAVLRGARVWEKPKGEHSHPIAAAPRLGRLMFAEVEGGNWRNEIGNFDVGY